MPPQHQGMGMPPQHQGMGMPPQHQGMGMPPQHQGMGMPGMGMAPGAAPPYGAPYGSAPATVGAADEFGDFSAASAADADEFDTFTSAPAAPAPAPMAPPPDAFGGFSSAPATPKGVAPPPTNFGDFAPAPHTGPPNSSSAPDDFGGFADAHASSAAPGWLGHSVNTMPTSTAPSEHENASSHGGVSRTATALSAEDFGGFGGMQAPDVEKKQSFFISPDAFSSGGKVPSPPPSEATAGLDELPKGAQVYYVDRDGSRKLATIVKVHHDDPPPYYTISIDGSERSTVREKLTVASESSPSLPPTEGLMGVPQMSAGHPVAAPPTHAGLGGFAMGAMQHAAGADFGGYGGPVGGAGGLGDFGAPAPTPSMPAADFGAVSAPSTAGGFGEFSAGSGAVVNDDDGFGDFGGFAGATPGAGAADNFAAFGGGKPAAAARGALSADDFGISMAPPAPAGEASGRSPASGEFGAPAPAARAGALSVDDFGGFDAPAPAAGVGAMSADDFGGFGAPAPAVGSDGGFGEFGGASAPAPSMLSGGGGTADDGFGDFGGFDTPSASANHTAGAGAVDDFGDFGDSTAGAAPKGVSTGTLPADEFGGFDAPAPAAGVRGGGLSADDFGGFGAAAPGGGGRGGSLSADDFGGFDGAAAGSSKPTADVPASGADDGFGDFGGFGDDSGRPAAVSDEFGDFGGGFAAPAPAARASALSVDDFGGFDAVPDSAFSGTALGDDTFSAAAHHPPATDEGFGDFGGFGEPSAPGAFATSSSGHDRSAVADPFAAVDDDFGDFGDFAASASAPPHGFSTLAADEDDKFGQFPAPTTVTPPPAASTQAPAVPADGLQALLAQLLEAERFEEAVACKGHIDGIAQVSVQKQAYDRAKEEDNLEEAIHIKNVVLPRLRNAIQPDAVVEAWRRPQSGVTISSMHATAKKALGADDAAPFIATYSRDLRALASTDLEQAAREQQRAYSSLQLLLELPARKQDQHLSQLHKLVETTVEQMRLAVSALESLPKDLDPAEREQAMHSPRVQELLRELAELRKLGCVLAKSREWHVKFFAASAGAPLGAACRVPAAEVRAQLTTLLKKAATLAVQEEPDEDEHEALSTARFWTFACPMSQRCYLSLLPLRCKEFPDQPPTVEWEGKLFQAPYANLWANCVSKTCP